MSLSIALIIPTLNAHHHFSQSPYLPEIITKFSTLIIDSSSNDSTVSDSKKLGAKIIIIPKTDFNHGATREFARKQLRTDIVVFLTQDAIPISADLIERLVAPLLENETVAVSYARQIPHHHAEILEAFPRFYNYGMQPQIRSLADVKQYGVYTFFCSNSCAAWRNMALDEIGGFKTVLTNEDYLAVADLLQKGYKIAYTPDAIVKHSHHFTLWQEFRRYVEIGCVRAQNPIIQQLVGQAEKRGVSFFVALLKQLWQKKPLLIPYAILQTAVKWSGYRLGFQMSSKVTGFTTFNGFK